MRTTFSNKKISGILTVLPEQEIPFEKEVANYSFPEAQSLRLKKIMGYKQHRVAKEGTSTSDLCVEGLNYLLDKEYLTKDEIGAIVVVTITPDHFVPHVSNIIHGECKLPNDILCIDISQGCCGYVLGLMQAFLLLEHIEDLMQMF